MSKSKPYDFCWQLKSQWEEIRKTEVYYLTPRDLRAAKEWLELNMDIPPEETTRGFVRRYLESDFEGWRDQGYPIHALLNHWNRYAEKKVTSVRRSTYTCPKCGTEHPVQAECPPVRDVGAIISPLTQKVRMK